MINRNLLIIVIVTGVVLAYLVPGVGLVLKKYYIDDIMVLMVFICQGAGIDTKGFSKGRGLVKLVLVGIGVAYILGPALGYLATRLVQFPVDDAVGLLLICSMTPTVVSGIVISGRAKGDTLVALFMTVMLCFIGVFTIPLNLKWALSATVSIDQVSLFKKLLFMVLIPAVIGQLLKVKLPGFVSKHTVFIKKAPVFMLGLLIFIKFSNKTALFKDISFMRILSLYIPSFIIHAALLAAGYFIVRYLLNMSESASRSLAIVSSQKSIAVGIPVWSAVFGADYPLAVIALVVFHFGQILFDGFVANQWAKTH